MSPEDDMDSSHLTRLKCLLQRGDCAADATPMSLKSVVFEHFRFFYQKPLNNDHFLTMHFNLLTATSDVS